jgi:hypothetical protein
MGKVVKSDGEVLAELPRRSVPYPAESRLARRQLKATQRGALAQRVSIPEGMSFLEGILIKHGTQFDYHRRVVEFMSWAKKENHDWETSDGLDAVLVKLFDVKFFSRRFFRRGCEAPGRAWLFRHEPEQASACAVAAGLPRLAEFREEWAERSEIAL